MPTPDPDNLVLELLRAIRGDIGGLKDDVRELKQRMTSLEIQVGSMVSTEQSHYGFIMQRFDRHDDRLDRIERRLDIAEAPV